MNKFNFTLTTISDLPDCPPVSYYKTGEPNFDRDYQGICKTGLTLIGAYPAHGKSLFTLDLAIKMAQNNPNLAVYYFSCENDPSDDLDRIKWLYPHLELPANQFHYMNLIGFEEWESRLETIRNTTQECIVFIDAPSVIIEDAPTEREAMVKLIRRLTKISMNHPLVTNWHLQRPSQNNKSMREEDVFKNLTGNNFAETNETYKKASYCYFVDYDGGFIMNVRCGKYRGKKTRDDITDSGEDAYISKFSIGER